MIMLQDLCVEAGAFHLQNISLSVPTGSYAMLMGKSGAGKTTLLETICGLRSPIAGRVVLDGREITHVRAGERGVGYVPQDGALFSTMTVREHLAFALRVRRRSSKEIAETVDELTVLLGLGELLQRLPAGLSGGETQRVALGRALSFRPRILCLDEPLSALDQESRAELGEQLGQLHRSQGLTVLHATHSLEESQKLGQHVFRLDRGVIIQEVSIGGRDPGSIAEETETRT